MNHSGAYTRLLMPQCFVGMTTQTRQALLDGSIKKSTLADLVKRMDAASCPSGGGNSRRAAAAPAAKPATPPPANARAPASKLSGLNRLFAPSMFASPYAGSRPAPGPRPLNRFFGAPARNAVKPKKFFDLSMFNGPRKPAATAKSATAKSATAGGKPRQNAYAKAIGSKNAPGTLPKELLQALNTHWPTLEEFGAVMRGLADAKQAAALNAGNDMTGAQRRTYNSLAKKAAKSLPKYKQLTKLQARMTKLGMANRNSATFAKWTASIQKEFDRAPDHIADALNPPAASVNNNSSWLNNSENGTYYKYKKNNEGRLTIRVLGNYAKNKQVIMNKVAAKTKNRSGKIKDETMDDYVKMYHRYTAQGRSDKAEDALYAIEVMEKMSGVPMTFENSTALKFRKQELKAALNAGQITPQEYKELLAQTLANVN